MRSLPPADYATLPRRAPPAGYICVIRDVDSDSFRIDGAQQPADLVAQALAIAAGDFGIEILAILETEDLAASAAELYAAYHAELSDEWLTLDPYQWQEMRRSALRVDDHASQYLAANRVSPGKAAIKASGTSAKETDSSTRRRFAANRRASRRIKPGPTAYKVYGTRALRRERRREAAQRAAQEPTPWRQSLSEGFDNLMQNRPGLFIALVLLVMLLFLIFAWRNPHPTPTATDPGRCASNPGQVM